MPSVGRRVAAIAALAERGWRLGLRFDPLIWSEDHRDRYRRLFTELFAAVDAAAIHSVSLGGFRLPKVFYERIWRQYPDERLLAAPLADSSGMISLPRDLERELVAFCREELRRHLPAERLFLCA